MINMENKIEITKRAVNQTDTQKPITIVASPIILVVATCHNFSIIKGAIHVVYEARVMRMT